MGDLWRQHMMVHLWTLQLPWGTLGIPETKVERPLDVHYLHQPLTYNYEKFNIL